MKIVIICVLLAFASPPDDLVEAAREGKRKRAKSRTEVITNEDVRQAKGNVTTTKAAPAPEPEAADVMSHEEAKAARIAAELRLEVAEANAEQLAAELARIEQQYYAEDDLDRRDRVIVRRFDEVRVRYDEAAKELEAARDNPALQLASPVTVIGRDLPPETPANANPDAAPATPRAEPTRPPSPNQSP